MNCFFQYAFVNDEVHDGYIMLVTQLVAYVRIDFILSI
jgi:hypothetical protein